MPIVFAIDLIRKRGVRAGINAEQPFDKTCFAFCRAPQHGIESWAVEKPWYQNSGKLPGGHNRTDECKKLIAAATVGDPTARIDLDPGEGDSSKGMWEDVDDNRLVVQYTYHCKGTYRSGPVYKRAQSAACGLWE